MNANEKMIVKNKQEVERIFRNFARCMINVGIDEQRYVDQKPAEVKGLGVRVEGKGIPILLEFDKERIAEAENALKKIELGFGKYRGKTLHELIKHDASYAQWLAEDVPIFSLWEIVNRANVA